MVSSHRSTNSPYFTRSHVKQLESHVFVMCLLIHFTLFIHTPKPARHPLSAPLISATALALQPLFCLSRRSSCYVTHLNAWAGAERKQVPIGAQRRPIAEDRPACTDAPGTVARGSLRQVKDHLCITAGRRCELTGSFCAVGERELRLRASYW